MGTVFMRANSTTRQYFKLLQAADIGVLQRFLNVGGGGVLPSLFSSLEGSLKSIDLSF